mgnify:CR=1 FL=1
MDISKYSDALVAHLANKVTLKEPASLYEPIDYILTLGGKRLRPVLTLMSPQIIQQTQVIIAPLLLAEAFLREAGRMFHLLMETTATCYLEILLTQPTALLSQKII